MEWIRSVSTSEYMAPRETRCSEYLGPQKPDGKQQLETSWEEKSLHGMSHGKIEDAAGIKKSYQGLKKAGLKDSTEALIMVAQENKTDRIWDLPHQARSRVLALQTSLRQSST